MAYESDLLISYARLDDQPLLEGQPGWVASLHRMLEIRVAQLLGEKPRIWRDPKLQGNDYFADTILSEQIPQVAALVTVLSPRYLQSDWCRWELEGFCRASEKEGGVRVGDKARIFKVIKTPIPLERHPAPLQPLLGYEFFVTDPVTGRAREMYQAFGPELERQFLARLDDLAHDICGLLETLRNGSPAPNGAAKGTVYLAETSFDLRQEREAIQRDLVRSGYKVLPDQALPLLASDFEAVVREQLARANLSVHLVGRSYGVVPDGTTRSVTALQHDLAVRQSASAGLPRVLWLAPGLGESEDERQQALIQHLRTAPEVHAGAELLEVPLEDLKSWIHRRLTAPVEEPKPRTQGVAAGGGIPRVYLICDQPDLERVRPLEDFLFDRGFEVVLPLFDEDETQARLDHEESLCTCDAVLLYYGEANEVWLRRKLREVQRSAGLGRDRPLRAKAIYIGSPPNPQKERFRTLETLVLREPGGGFAPASLDPLLAEIQGKGSSS